MRKKPKIPGMVFIFRYPSSEWNIALAIAAEYMN
jgi:hypothetical protein